MYKKKKIFAIVGMAGSGKSEAVDYLKEKFRWPHVYFGQVIFDEMKKQGLEMNQKNERKTREKLREDEGMGVCALKSLESVGKALEKSNNVLIESLYSWDEHKIMKRAYPDYYKVIAVFASPAVRFSRLKSRKERPLKTFEDFEQRDRTEIEKTDKGGPIAVADYMIINDGSIDDLHREVDRILIKEGIEGPRAGENEE
jgi:dephospho-CoA kinase